MEMMVVNDTQYYYINTGFVLIWTSRTMTSSYRIAHCKTNSKHTSMKNKYTSMHTSMMYKYTSMHTSMMYKYTSVIVYHTHP